MRDPNRIEPFLAELAKQWRKTPDWRFGQFMCNLLGEISCETKRDVFYIEDDEMFELLCKSTNRMIYGGDSEDG